MRAGVLLVAALMLAGCGSKDGGDGFETPARDGERYVIVLSEDRSFEPAKAKVPTDALVTFRFELENCDVRSKEPGGPDSSKQYSTGIHRAGGSFNWFAPPTPQDFHISCSAYEGQGMKAVIRVV